MTWTLNLQVTQKEWLSKPEIRWSAGLQHAGLNWRQSMSRSHYPPLPSSGNVRTYQLADRASFNETELGKTLEFGSTFYAPFVLFGTYKWQGWPGHLAMVVSNMKAGFAYGVENYGG